MVSSLTSFPLAELMTPFFSRQVLWVASNKPYPSVCCFLASSAGSISFSTSCFTHLVSILCWAVLMSTWLSWELCFLDHPFLYGYSLELLKWETYLGINKWNWNRVITLLRTSGQDMVMKIQKSDQQVLVCICFLPFHVHFFWPLVLWPNVVPGTPSYALKW